MSLSHGHLYMADKLIGALGEKVRPIVTANLGEYRSGALGPDIMYWANAVSLRGIFGDGGLKDLHVGRTGRFVRELIEGALAHRRLGDPGADEFLALALGWSTHWATDLYIHALVDRYGGQYDQNTSRHLQLELVETKYVHTLLKQQNRTVDLPPIKNGWRMWDYMIEAFARAYAVNGIGYVPGKEPERVPGALASNFVGLSVISGALRAAEDSCNELVIDGSIPDDYLKQAEIMRRFHRPLLSTDNAADLGWASKGGVIPSEQTYKALRDPIDICVTSDDAGLDVVVTVRDTGLYGKFLVEYDGFLAGALTRAGSIASVVNNYLADLDTLSAPVDPEHPLNDWERLGYREQLRQLLSDPRLKTSVNILVPDAHWPMLAEESPDRASVLNNARPTAYAVNREKIHCELLVERESGELPPIILDVPLTPLGTNGLFASRTVDAIFRLPIPNPEKQRYAYELTVSLDGKEALNEPRYEGVEFKRHRGMHIDIGLIRGATAVKVGFQGRTETRVTPEPPPITSPAWPSPYWGGMPLPETTIVINGQRVDDGGVTPDLFWQADGGLVAHFREQRDNRPISQPGTEPQPVCGQYVHEITIKATPDFARRLVSFEAVETWEDHCHAADPLDCSDLSGITCFSAQDLPPIAFGDEYIRFGVEDFRLLKQSACVFRDHSTASGRLYPESKSWEKWLPETFPENADICFYIEFRL